MRRSVRSPHLLHYLGQQFVGMQAALHQGLRLAGKHHGDRQFGGMMAVFGRHQPVWCQIQILLRGDGPNLVLRADQNGRDQVVFSRLDRATQRVGATRVDHRAT